MNDTSTNQHTSEPRNATADPLHFDPAEFSHIVVDGPNAEETWTVAQWNEYIDRCKDPRTGGEIIFKVVRLIPAETEADDNGPTCRDCGTWPCARHATEADKAEYAQATSTDRATITPEVTPLEYLIWSHEHGAWWKPARLGYTGELGNAGRYSEGEALSTCENACYRWLHGDKPAYGDLPAEVMIPAALAGAHSRTVRAAIDAVTDAVVQARCDRRPICDALREAGLLAALPAAEVAEGCVVRSAGWWCTVVRVERLSGGLVRFEAATGDASTWADDATVLVRTKPMNVASRAFRVGDLVEIVGRGVHYDGKTGIITGLDDGADGEYPISLDVEGFAGPVWCNSSEIRFLGSEDAR